METIEFNACPLGPFFDLGGKPVAGGRLWLLDSATSVPESAYTDAAGTVASENPAPLGGDGCLEQQLWLRKGVSYAMRLYKPTSATSVYDPGDFPNADWSLVRTWVQESEEGAAVSAVVTVDTIADLKALDPSTVDGMAVEVLGYYAKGDCAARTYLWTAGAYSDADNGAVVGAPAYSGTDAWVLISATGDDISSAVWGDVVGQPDNAFPSIAATAANWCASNGKRLVLEPGLRKVNGTSAGLEIAFSCPTVLEDGIRMAVLNSQKVELVFNGQDTEIRPASNLLYGLGGVVSVKTGGAFRGVLHSNLVNWSTGWSSNLVFSAGTTVVLDGDVTVQRLANIPVLDANGYTLTDAGGSLTIGRIIRAEGDDPAVDASSGLIYILSDFRASDVSSAAFAKLQLSTQRLTLTMDADRELPKGQYSWPNVTLKGRGGLLSIQADGGTRPCNKIELYSIESDVAIFGTGFDYYKYYDVYGYHFYVVVAPAVQCLEAHHFDGSLNAAKMLALSANNGCIVRLEGKTCTSFPVKTNVDPAELESVLVAKVCGPGTVSCNLGGSHQNISFDGVDIIVDGYAEVVSDAQKRFRDCRIQDNGVGGAIKQTASSGNFSALIFQDCSISGVDILTENSSGTSELKIEGCTFAQASKISAANGDCKLISNTFIGSGAAPITLSGRFDRIMIRGNVLYGIAGASVGAIDSSGVTSISHVCIVDNTPSKYGSDYWWPQTEGSITDVANVNQTFAPHGYEWTYNMFKPAISPAGSVSIVGVGCDNAEWAIETGEGIYDFRLNRYKITGGDVVEDSSTTPQAKFTIFFDFTR